MIKSIYVKNFVLIDELQLDFESTFSCFTGETGAGKSLLIDAISILCGGRVSSHSIQKGAVKALIEAQIEIIDPHHPALSLLIEAGYELEENTFILTREFNLEGKSTTRINQRVTTLSFVKDIMSLIVDIHSQHDSQYLLNNKYHLSLLDEFTNAFTLLDKTTSSYKEYKKKKDELEKFEKEEANPDDLEYLNYQLDEINAIDIQENEIETLQQQQKDMTSFEKVNVRLKEAVEEIESSGYEALYSVRKHLDNIDNEVIDKAKEEILSAYYIVDEQLITIKEYMNTLEFDEKLFDEIQTRLFEIHKVIRKHGNTYTSYLEKKEEIENKIAFIENRQTYLSTLEKEVDKAYQIFYEEALCLSKIRKEKALELEIEIQKELHDLHLENAQFKVSFEEQVNTKGIDKIEFLISMNLGETLKPLAKVASGGELSRLMLGLKTIFNKLQKIQTIIFDEIDNGVSGNVANSIGKKMNTIGKNSQVFAVSHLAPVAAWSNNHYLVEKKQDNNKTTTNILLLDEEKTLKELAMISQGIISEQSLLAAKELYNACKR